MYIAQTNVKYSYAGFWSESIRNPHDILNDFESEIEMFLETNHVVSYLLECQNVELPLIYNGLQQLGVCREVDVQLAKLFSQAIKSA